MMSMRSCVCATVVAGCALAGTASADVINIASNPGIEGLGSYSGSLDYTAASGTLVVSLTNLMTTAAGGKITGFVFNIDGSPTAALTAASHPFLNLTGGGLSAAPFGTFEAGAALGGDWTGGGSPNAGIVRGATGTFTFHVSGAGAGALTASSFIGGDNDPLQFAVRFRGFDNGGSDKVGGHEVPAPATAGLAAAGLAAIGRRRRAK